MATTKTTATTTTMKTNTTTNDPSSDQLRARLHKLGLFGLLAQWDEVGHQP